jgi:thiosulfate/3-mercaptopyruvate sulfurtransferase
MYTTLISVTELQTLQASGQPLMVFDCSFELMKPGAGDAQYQQSHIAGALRADLDRHLCAHSGKPAVCAGRHPLPTRESFAAWLGSVGFRPDMQAVVYDRQGVNYAGRLWWMLKWAGHEAVAVLNGGLQAWVAAQGPLASGTGGTPPIATNYALGPARMAWVATQEVAEHLGRPSQTVIDARATPRYLGEIEPIDPVAGHLPGALNRPFALNLGADGCFKTAAELRLLLQSHPAQVVAGRRRPRHHRQVPVHVRFRLPCPMSPPKKQNKHRDNINQKNLCQG